MGVRIRKAPTIPHGTYYWSCAGINFNCQDNARAYEKDEDTGIMRIEALMDLTVNVNLPDGAVVIAAICFGNFGENEESWKLYRTTLTTPVISSMAGHWFNEEDTSINYATIDNSTYSYFFIMKSFNTGDEVFGARITYTL